MNFQHIFLLRESLHKSLEQVVHEMRCAAGHFSEVRAAGGRAHLTFSIVDFAPG